VDRKKLQTPYDGLTPDQLLQLEDSWRVLFRTLRRPTSSRWKRCCRWWDMEAT